MLKNIPIKTAIFTLGGAAAVIFLLLGAIQGGIFSVVIVAPYTNNLTLQPIVPKSTVELERLFDRAHYDWPLSQQQSVPPLLVQSLPGDFAEIDDTARKKALFLRALLPLVLMENQKLHNQRKLILQMLMQRNFAPRPDSLVEQALDRLTRRYRIDQDIGVKKSLAKLLIRLDEIPPSLVLAQGVIESGWGSSRFALQGNSLFGEWTYQPNQGLAPLNRNEHEHHFVRAFPDIYASLRSYMNNLNTGKSYQMFRIMRAEMRRKQQPLKSLELATGLEKYSTKGREYVDYVRKVIEANDLQELDELSLAIQVY